jgi:predicted dienelactone hydrolase
MQLLRALRSPPSKTTTTCPLKGPASILGTVMRLSVMLLGTVVGLAPALALAAGIQFYEVPADAAGGALTGAAWYPCSAPQQETIVKNGVIRGTRGCLLSGDKLPLIVISHGRAGWFGGHHATAAALADAGFVVAAIDHPGDNASDKSRVDDLSTLVERPADIKRLVDFMLGSWANATRLDRDRIGFFGFSMGGYTGLVAIGGDPDFRKDLPGCEGSGFRACEQLRNGEVPVEPPTHDARIKAAVIVDPGPSIFFPAASLKAVKVPVQLWSSDPKLSSNYEAGCCAIGVNRRMPESPEYHLVAGAIHFSFLPPCSASETKEFPRICVDAPGFDRTAFHKEFDANILAFFRKHLLGAETP